MIKSSSGGRVKVKTRCVREQDYQTLTKNPTTTRTWPVIHRNSTECEYEVLYKIDSTSNSDLNAYDQEDSDHSLDASTSYIRQKMQTQTETPNRTCCMAPPPIIFLFVTLLVTTGTTALLCGAIMSDHWENVTWDRTILEKLTRNTTNTLLQWQLDGRVAIVTAKQNERKENLYLVPMHGGIWTLCIDISESDMRFMGRFGFPNTQKCVNYLADEVVLSGDDLYRNTGFPSNYHPRIRMQNLSISCSLVCMIILGSAALVGAFGVCQRQISAILVTGVMYLLAALFGLFTLMIIYVKRQHEKPDYDFDGTIEGLIAPRSVSHLAKNLFEARVFSKSWSLTLGWFGVLMCSITSGMWILLSKIMRYNSYSST